MVKKTINTEKLYIKVTAFVGFIVGFLMIVMPQQVIEILFNTILNGAGGLISAMIAGTTIITLSIVCWLLNDNKLAQKVIKAMLFYNIAIIGVVMYLVELYNIESNYIWVIILFHLFMTLWSIKLIKK